MNRAFCPVLHRNTIMFVCSFSFCRRARGTVDQLCLSAAVKLCTRTEGINPLNAELNPIRHLLALVGARHIVHVSRVRVKNRRALKMIMARMVYWWVSLKERECLEYLSVNGRIILKTFFFQEKSMGRVLDRSSSG